MPNGVVTKWVEERGFGFVHPYDGGDDLFAHVSSVCGALPSTGDFVCFEREFDQRKGMYKVGSLQVTSKAWEVQKAQKTVKSVEFGDLLPVDDISPFPQYGGQASLQAFLEIALRGSSLRGNLGYAPGWSECLPWLQDFVLLSSLGCPFLVVSDTLFAADVRRASASEFQLIADLVSAYIAGCESLGAVFTADFEGELLGHGGEVETGAFQLTSVIDPPTLQPRRPENSEVHHMGLLLDLRCSGCLPILRAIMEAPHILKLMWGADGDCISLLYQQMPTLLNVDAQGVIDLQLAFSTDLNRRLGMGRMLDQVPAMLTVGLPEKEQIDWDAAHCQNRRALRLPMSSRDVAYAVDDLHRIEVILRSRRPPSGSYAEARNASWQVLQGIRGDPMGLDVLQKDFQWFERLQGVKRMVCAVKMMRHVTSLRLRRDIDATSLPEYVLEVERILKTELEGAGVEVSSSLKFNGDDLRIQVPPSRPPGAHFLW